MKSSVGGIDRSLRVAAGLVLIAMAISSIDAPWIQICVVPLATGLIGWYPAYLSCDLSTTRRSRCFTRVTADLC